MGSAADPYTEAGLDFDQGGLLWAVTDRRLPDDLPSQSMQVDPQTGTASGKKILQEIGFETIDPYNDNPNATRWYGKSLDGDQTG